MCCLSIYFKSYHLFLFFDERQTNDTFKKTNALILQLHSIGFNILFEIIAYVQRQFQLLRDLQSGLLFLKNMTCLP